MLKFMSAIFALSLSPTAANADDFDPLIGEWVSPDGFAKMSWVRRFDGSYVESKMWFQSEGAWRLVGVGAAYQRPGEPAWRANSRTRDMDDIELFESTIQRGDETVSYRVKNIAYFPDGSTLRTEEDWVFRGPDSFSYTIFKVDQGKRTPWMKGDWIRLEESQ